MASNVSFRSLMRRLLSVSSAAADVGEFEVAYHALMAALHAAERVGKDAGDPSPLAEIERMAKAQSEKVEKILPAHQLSKAAAKNRGHVSVYETLLLHAKSARMRIEADTRRETSPFRWPNLTAVK
ncbi:MAG TPA: hypothetical protein VJ852_14400 [Gemmatimonadaceae bacterium]|nr:hypothetical protein [Gemmatimonadaceae bacterium]